MKITPQQWIEVVKLISTFIIGLITALCIQSCTASMSIFGKIVILPKRASRLRVSLLTLLVLMFNQIFNL